MKRFIYIFVWLLWIYLYYMYGVDFDDFEKTEEVKKTQDHELGDYYIKWYVLQKDEDKILIAEWFTWDSYDWDIWNILWNAWNFNITNSTKFKWVDFDWINKYDKVKLWEDWAIMESYPVQWDAKKIKLISYSDDFEEHFDSENNISFSIPHNAKKWTEAWMTKITYDGWGDTYQLTDWYILYIYSEESELSLEDFSENLYNEQTQVLESKSKPDYSWNIDWAYEFSIIWGYWNEHKYYIFDYWDKKLVVFYTIVGPNNKYKDTVYDIIDSISLD